VRFERIPALKREIVGLWVTGQHPTQSTQLALGELHGQDGNDLPGHIVLDSEDVANLAVVAFGSDVVSGGCIHQLGGDPHPVPGPLDAPLQDIAHAEVAAYVSHIDGAALIGEDRVPRDDEQARDL
jgi:hypothetical protein